MKNKDNVIVLGIRDQLVISKKHARHQNYICSNFQKRTLSRFPATDKSTDIRQSDSDIGPPPVVIGVYERTYLIKQTTC